MGIDAGEDDAGARGCRTRSRWRCPGCPRNCAEATIKDFGVVARGFGLGDARRRQRRHQGPRHRVPVQGGDARPRCSNTAPPSCSCTARRRATWSAPRPGSSASAWPTSRARLLDDAEARRALAERFAGVAAPRAARPLGGARPRVPRRTSSAAAARGVRPMEDELDELVRGRTYRRHSAARRAHAWNTPRRATSPCSAPPTTKSSRCSDRCPHKGGPLSQGIVHGAQGDLPAARLEHRTRLAAQAVAPDEGCHRPLPGARRRRGACGSPGARTPSGPSASDGGRVNHGRSHPHHLPLLRRRLRRWSREDGAERRGSCAATRSTRPTAGGCAPRARRWRDAGARRSAAAPGGRRPRVRWDEALDTVAARFAEAIARARPRCGGLLRVRASC